MTSLAVAHTVPRDESHVPPHPKRVPELTSRGQGATGMPVAPSLLVLKATYVNGGLASWSLWMIMQPSLVVFVV